MLSIALVSIWVLQTEEVAFDSGLYVTVKIAHFIVGSFLNFIVGSIDLLAYGLKLYQHGFVFLWFEDTSHGYASILAPCFFVVVDMPCSIQVAFGFSCPDSALEGISFLSLEPWSCCFMVSLVWSLFNIWPPSIVVFGPSFHFFFFLLLWISSLILDILIPLVLCFYLEWLRTLDG